MRPNAALAALHCAVLLFGFAGLFGKWLDLPPAVIVLGRTLVAATALGLLRALQGKRGAPFDLRLAGMGALLAAHWVSFYAAIQVASVAIGLLGFASFPLFVLLLERALLGRRWSAREGATAGFVTVGLALLVPELSFANRMVQGLLWGLLSGFTFALLAVANRRWSATRAPLHLAFWQNLWAAIALVPFVAALGSPPAIGAREIGLLLLLGVVGTALAHTLFITALATVSAHTASMVCALEPVYGILLALLLLGEVPAPRTLVGGALIVGAAVLATRRARDG